MDCWFRLDSWVWHLGNATALAFLQNVKDKFLTRFELVELEDFVRGGVLGVTQVEG